MSYKYLESRQQNDYNSYMIWLFSKKIQEKQMKIILNNE